MNTTSSNKQIAYFSIEIALDPAMPTYSAGLGILAGDTLRAAAEQICQWSFPIFYAMTTAGFITMIVYRLVTGEAIK